MRHVMGQCKNLNRKKKALGIECDSYVKVIIRDKRTTSSGLF